LHDDVKDFIGKSRLGNLTF